MVQGVLGRPTEGLREEVVHRDEMNPNKNSKQPNKERNVKEFVVDNIGHVHETSKKGQSKNILRGDIGAQQANCHIGGHRTTKVTRRGRSATKKNLLLYF